MKKTLLLLCVALTIGAVMMASCKKDNAPSEPAIVLTEGAFVDMGGSVLWCSRNLGANNPYEDGEYYAFDANKQGNASEIDAQLTGTWRLPTKDEVEELIKNQKWVTLNGVNGYLLTGTNGNTLFIPCAGRMVGTELRYKGTEACFWTKTLLGSSKYYSVIGENEAPLELSTNLAQIGGKFTLRVVMNKE